MIEKAIRKYGNVYRKSLLSRHCREIEAKTAAHVYAVIAMCLEMKTFGLTDTEIIRRRKSQ